MKHCKLRHLHYLVPDINGYCYFYDGSGELFWVLDAIFALFLPLIADAHLQEKRTDTEADYASSFPEFQPERDPL